MLYGLFSLQTNLCISSHDQSDVLWHNGTNYKQLLFSSDIWAGTSAMGICTFFYMWHWFCGQLHSNNERERDSVHMWNKWKWWNSTGPVQHYLCISRYKIQCSGVPAIYAQKWGSICLGYMCICLYVKLIWCSGVAWVYDRLMGGPSAIGIFAFIYMWNLFGVVVLHGSMINWWGVHLP